MCFNKHRSGCHRATQPHSGTCDVELTNDVDFVDKANAEICDHSLFTLQFSYIEKLTSEYWRPM